MKPIIICEEDILDIDKYACWKRKIKFDQRSVSLPQLEDNQQKLQKPKWEKELANLSSHLNPSEKTMKQPKFK